MSDDKAMTDKLADALRIARNGLQWYQDRYPESADGCDDEAMAQIDAALSEHDTRPAQATWSDERPSVMWLPNRISAKDLAFSTTDECLAYQNGWNHCIEATLSSPENKMRKPDAVDKACEAVAAASHRLFYGSGSAQAAQPEKPPFVLERWGFPVGQSQYRLERMADGYWTPWHIAQQALADTRARMQYEFDKAREQAAQPVGVPDGWVMVPKHDVTSDMIRVGMEWITNCQTDFDRACMVTCIFGEMCKAAPQPPAQPSADAEDAARYRWARSNPDIASAIFFDADISCVTEEIDAARAAEGDGK